MNKLRKKRPESYRKREYRKRLEATDLASIQVQIRETDLHILASQEVGERARELILQYRLQLENYIVRHPEFSATLDPLEPDIFAPRLVREMMEAGVKAAVGPMAAVAGAISEAVGRDLLKEGVQEVIIENGGDIYLKRDQDCTVAIFAGRSPLSYKVGIRIGHSRLPLGVCTSSGTVGHSLSLGEADSVTVVAKSTALADAAATRLGNEVGRGRDPRVGLDRALAAAKTIEGIDGVVIICGELIGALGDVELVRLSG